MLVVAKAAIVEAVVEIVASAWIITLVKITIIISELVPEMWVVVDGVIIEEVISSAVKYENKNEKKTTVLIPELVELVEVVELFWELAEEVEGSVADIDARKVSPQSFERRIEVNQLVVA
jgi:hypothetical protein